MDTIDGYGTTYNNDICLNESDSKNGTYSPYAKSNVELTEELSTKLDSSDYKLTDLINDTTKSTSTVYSSNKVESKLAGYLPITKLTGKTSYTIDPTNYHMIFFDCVKDNARLKSIIGVGQTGQCELVSGSTFAKITNSSSTSVTITGQTTPSSLTLICI